MSSAHAHAPVKPIRFEPNQVYLQVSFSSPEPPALSHSGLQVKYLGPVGELKGEAVYQVLREGGAVKRDEAAWSASEKPLLENVKREQGVEAVKVLPELKQRAKRDEF